MTFELHLRCTFDKSSSLNNMNVLTTVQPVTDKYKMHVLFKFVRKFFLLQPKIIADNVFRNL